MAVKGRKHPPDCGHCEALRGRPSGFAGKRHTDEAKRKIAAWGTGRPSPKSADQRAQISATLTGRSLSAEHRAKIGAAHKGRTWTPEQRARISATLKGHAVSPATREKLGEAAARQLSTTPRAGTQPEQIMAAILEWAGVEFEGQRRFGRYVVDFYLPQSCAVLEVDGRYWHRDRPPEQRDAALLGQGVSTVHHVTDTDLETRGWL